MTKKESLPLQTPSLEHHTKKIGVTGFEPATSRPPAVRSSQAEPYPDNVGYYNLSFIKKQEAVEIFYNNPSAYYVILPFSRSNRTPAITLRHTAHPHLLLRYGSSRLSSHCIRRSCRLRYVRCTALSLQLQ